MRSDEPSPDLVERLTEEYLQRRRRGERPTVVEYVARYPKLADRIIEVLPALELIERFRPTPGDRADQCCPLSAQTSPTGATADDHCRKLGDYQIIRELGRGGMGVVYEAQRESLQKSVALKIMHPRYQADPASVTRFLTEARSAARLHHTNIVPVFDFGQHDGVYYYVMQFIAGVGMDRVLEDVCRLQAHAQVGARSQAETELLETVIERQAPEGPLAVISHGLLTGRFADRLLDSLADTPGAAGSVEMDTLTAPIGADLNKPGANGFCDSAPVHQPMATTSTFAGRSETNYFREVARISAQVADALDYAHHKGVVHRDIKPSNLLLDALGNVWVTDFGLAKLIENEEISQPLEMAGTLRFMAPERFRGVTDRRGRGDVYALGATLYELLTLRPAFREPDRDKLTDRILHQPPKPLRSYDRRIPRDLETIVLKALAKDPKDRFATAGELRDELQRFMESRPIRSRPVSSAERFARWCKRNPGLSAATITATLLTVLLALGAATAAWVYRQQRDEVSFEQNLTKASLKSAEESGRKARLELGHALLAEGVALQRSGLMGQRFDSLDRLRRAAQELIDEPKARARLAELRDHAITAMGLTDLRVRWQRKIGTVMSIAEDRQHERYAIFEPHSGQAVVRRVADDQELLRVPRPDFGFWHAFPCFSPDGQYLADFYLAGAGGLTDVWHIHPRERILHELTRSNTCVFHPDGRRMVFAPPGKDLVVWDLVARRELKRLPLDFRPECLRLDPAGRRIAANAAELDRAGSGQVQILDLETGQMLAAWKGLLGDSALSWSGDGRLIATGHDHGRVFVWDVARGRLASVLQGHTNRVVGCDFAPAGHLLATNSWDGTARLWDASTGEPLLSVSGCSPLDFSSNGDQLAFQSGPTLGSWDVAHDEELRTLNPELIGNQTASRKDDGVCAADFAPDGTLVVLGTREGAYLYDALSGQELARLDTGPCATVLHDRQGQNLITCGERGLFRWPIRSDPNGGANALRIGPPELLHEVASSDPSWTKACWLPDHHTLAMIDNGNAQVVLVDTAHPHPARSCAPCLSSGSNHRMTSIAVSPDGRWAAAGGWKEAGITIWDLPRRRLELVLPPSDDNFDSTFAVSFSPDGRWLASCSCNPSAPGHYLWDVGTWKRWTYLPEHGGFLTPPVFSHDGRLLARTVSLQQIRLVEVATGRTIAHLSTLQPLNQTPLAFSPDGTRLIAMTNRKTALLYDLRRIRGQLRTMDLDWDQPPFPEEAEESIPAPVRSIRVVAEMQEPPGLVDEPPSSLPDDVFAGGR